MKYGKYSLGQIEAVLNKLGGEEAVNGILEGTKHVDVREAVRFHFDRAGRCIPYDPKSKDCEANRSFKFTQPVINYAYRLNRLVNSFPRGTKFCTVDEFEEEITALRTQIDADPRFKNWDKGVWLPLVLPQTEAGDYGTLLESRFLAAVETSYTNEFPKRSFRNYRKGDLAGKITIVHSSHARLIAKMQQRSVIGILLPNPLQGFSIPGDRAYADYFPEMVHLAGGYDFTTAIAAYPDVLGRGNNTPGNDMSALQWGSDDCSLFCEVRDHKQLSFEYRAIRFRYVAASACESGGLFFAR